MKKHLKGGRLNFTVLAQNPLIEHQRSALSLLGSFGQPALVTIVCSLIPVGLK